MPSSSGSYVVAAASASTGAVRLIGVTFFLLAAHLVIESIRDLISQARPEALDGRAHRHCGDRWTRLQDDAFEMFLAHYTDGTRRAAQPAGENEGAAHGHQQPAASR